MATTSRDRQDGSGESGGSRGNARGGGGNGLDRGGPQARSLGRQIADLFGGLTGYQNNPNRPNYNTTTMGKPLSVSATSVMMGQNVGMSPLASAGVNAVTSLMSGIGPAMGVTRGIQAATGFEGGPSIGGRTDGNTSFGGGGGDGNTGVGVGSSRTKTVAKKKQAAATLAPANDDWTSGRNPDATKLLMDQILSQSLNPSASQIMLGG